MNPLKYSDFTEVNRPICDFQALNEKLIEFLLKVKIKNPVLKCGILIADKLASHPRLMVTDYSPNTMYYLYIGNCKVYLDTDFEINPNEIYFKKGTSKIKIVEE
jgi:hypothetical protein